MISVKQSVADALGFDLTEAVVNHRAALAAHRQTVNQPAPVPPHPLVATICADGGLFEIVEDESGLPPDHPESLTTKLAAAEARAAALQKALLDAGILTPEQIAAAEAV